MTLYKYSYLAFAISSMLLVSCNKDNSDMIETDPDPDAQVVVCDLEINVVEFLAETLTADYSGGSEPFSYLWSTGETTSVISVTASGTYELVMTDAEGCEAMDELEVTITTGGDPCDTLDGEVDFDEDSMTLSIFVTGGTAPFTYEWSTGETTARILADQEGFYQVMVTDAEGCGFVLEYYVTITGGDPCELFTGRLNYDETSMTITAFVSGGTPPYAYTWSTGETQENIFAGEEGTYEVVATDSEGCTLRLSYTVSGSGEDPCNSFDVELDYDASAMTLTAIPAGGTPPYVFEWSTSENVSTISVSSGTYYVRLTDSVGCALAATIDIP